MLIGVAGNGIGCGKTTVARTITKLSNFIEVNSADELKRILLWLNPFNTYFDDQVRLIINNLFRTPWSSELHAVVQDAVVDAIKETMKYSNVSLFRCPEYEELFIEKTEYSRVYMQSLAERFRDIQPNIWIDFTIDIVAERNAIIGDVRYKNEVHRIREKGGIVLYVNRPQQDQQSQGLAKNDSTGYKGEKDLDDYPFADFPHEAIILNDSDLSRLQSTSITTVTCMLETLGVHFIEPEVK
ncbi:MAG: hypothetical protein DRJ03_18630 [Chloroflexi bacterium]|nr:MAG: hypothetical protein DRJ03_18630 [Chloroflexota bacterium]